MKYCGIQHKTVAAKLLLHALSVFFLVTLEDACLAVSFCMMPKQYIPPASFVFTMIEFPAIYLIDEKKKMGTFVASHSTFTAEPALTMEMTL